MSDRRSLVALIAVVAIAVAAVAGVWAVRFGGTSTGASDFDPGPGRFVVAMDGWSYAMAGPNTTWGAGRGTVSESILWRDITESDAVTLLEASPEVVANLMARVVVAVPRPECDKAGCKSGDRKLPLSYLSDPSSIPGYGPMYQRWGIGPVKVAQLSLTQGTTGIRFANGDAVTGEFSVTGPEGGSTTSTVPVDDLEPGQTGPVLDGPANALALGSGFGTLFGLSPRWQTANGTQPEQAYTSPSLVLDFNTAGLDLLKTTASNHSGGPSVTDRSMWGIGNSALTAFTSPTTGCLGLSLCTPSEVSLSVDGGVTEVFAACDSKTSPGQTTEASGNAPRTQVALLVRDETWTPTLPHPIAQGGAWGGSEPTQPVGGIWGAGPMPLYDGSHPLRVQTVTVYSGQSAVTGFAGRIWEVGVDQEGPWARPDVLAALGEGRFVDCATVPHGAGAAAGTFNPGSAFGGGAPGTGGSSVPSPGGEANGTPNGTIPGQLSPDATVAPLRPLPDLGPPPVSMPPQF